MTDVKYQLRYMPLFYEDLEEKVLYIAYNLKNPEAANKLVDAVEEAIMERLPAAEAQPRTDAVVRGGVTRKRDLC